jgi:hypothetical protein
VCLTIVEIGRIPPAEAIILVDAADVRSDEEIVVAQKVWPHLDRFGVTKLRLGLAASIVDIAVGVGHERSETKG